MTRSITRRQTILGSVGLGSVGLGSVGLGSAGVVGAAKPAHAIPSSLPAQPSLLVAGPVGSPVDFWADVIAPPLGRLLLGGGRLAWENVGGVDGVTGINQFQARTPPDGATALLLPGTALLAWLAGDTRARFDAGAWAPLWGGTMSAMVATRTPLMAGRPVRLAVGNVAGAELGALLALELIGVEVVPVPVTATDALARADVDAVYVRGAAMRDLPGALASQGWRPAFTLSQARNPAFPDVPQAEELFQPARATDAALLAGFRAASAAASLDVALVLPAVAPSTVLAWWRRGCAQMDDEAPVRDAAAAAALRQADAGEVAAQLSCVTLDMSAMLSLRTLLAERYHFRPT